LTLISLDVRFLAFTFNPDLTLVHEIVLLNAINRGGRTVVNNKYFNMLKFLCCYLLCVKFSLHFSTA